ncbi:MAG: glycine dehydrogenase subunit 2 [Gemmatimonadetes bacterium]|uniref:Probable glycine dehydrogenase (decarboxylating) subunit 2 n=1 Tax=Candidatus Kutchimonas denitrificans TaxID=3056748 RepID=A0AAE4ZCM1_9BACT|nr:glycine dehydrogenase subunit 2 [Gemmatimonadota bacterium]NIR75310.1 glycine dehydrogenase subunit 2 [Candidatus Kutchimonas denitrificans]NIS02136.1 glycine dehydrogenase subunit 2 [Gemmatimonadota bacterium]NIT67961.1 glycine dehydrogenase subunit 2 [Gemmatimonadota bacterium]NIU53955.1 aminotransferase class V-fold PLP-dependent enzyme [Gemmatimonadota bacterium]
MKEKNPKRTDSPLIFERSRPGRRGTAVPEPDVPTRPLEELLPKAMMRKEPPSLPEVSENEVVRHFTEISLMNHHVDRGFYPLGSCTMKYNPKVNEQTARLPGLADLHPFQPTSAVQGALRLMWELGEMLKEIVGMDEITLQPAAGAQGELVGALLFRAYHTAQGDPRKKIIIPDSAHGTNPATVRMAGYEVVTLKSNEEGRMDPGALESALGEDVAGVMLTNPNTLGKFESDVEEIARLVHEAGGLMYMDGANLNALIGVARPGDLGYDIVHLNLHKTFSTPHGGGGPGAGPVAVKEHLAPYLPLPILTRAGDGGYALDWERPESIGKVHGFWGNFGVLVRAYTYIRMLGRDGMRRTGMAAVLNNAYMSARLEGTYSLPYGRGMHESVFSGSFLKEHGVRTLDVAKRLLDFGVHAPTVYFPLIVPEAIMAEPTETETKDELDRFCEAMLQIAEEAKADPEFVKNAPYSTPVRRLDEALANRRPNVRYRPEGSD